MRLVNTLASFCALATAALAVDPIIVKNQELIIESSGERFVIIGVDYQPGGEAAYGTGQGDPLSNSDACLRDAALMQSLGINTVRVYNVDPTLDHNLCMSIFNSVGIYMLLDVNSPLDRGSLNRLDPASSYTTDYLIRVFTVVEAFKDFPNLLGFFSANELINDLSTAKNAPWIRAITRDLKNYIAAHAERTIPVGYSAAQVQEVLHDSWAYLQCDDSNEGSSDMSRSDFFGLNSYSWCGAGSSFTISGYNVLVEWFSNSSIPTFFSEYGCDTVLPRLFEEVNVLYGPQMVSVMSGGLVYQWTNDIPNFGLVQTFGNGSAQLLPDYFTVKSRYDELNITLLTTQNNSATNLQPPRCNADLIQNSAFSTDFDIPQAPAGAAELISKGVSNAATGSIVSVTKTTVTGVYQTDGSEVTGLAIHAVNGANTPGGASVSGSGNSPGGSSTSSGLAARPTSTSFGGSAVAAAVFGVAVIAL